MGAWEGAESCPQHYLDILKDLCRAASAEKKPVTQGGHTVGQCLGPPSMGL